MKDQLVFTVTEMAQELRVSKGSAYNLVNSGEVRSVRCGRSIRVPRTAILEFLNEGVDPRADANTMPDLSEGNGHGQ